MKSKYLECIEEAYKQFNLFTVKEKVNNDDYLVLIRNANENYDISEFVTNKESLAYDIFDKWRDKAKNFKFVVLCCICCLCCHILPHTAEAVGAFSASPFIL